MVFFEIFNWLVIFMIEFLRLKIFWLYKWIIIFLFWFKCDIFGLFFIVCFIFVSEVVINLLILLEKCLEFLSFWDILFCCFEGNKFCK